MRASIIVAVFVVGFVGGLLAAAQKQESSGLPAERVTGIGGVFLKARDPKALSVWYREKLGLAVGDGAEWSPFVWREREDPGRVGTTVWALFRSDSTYFAPSQASFMINYRVRDLDRMLAQLRALGVSVESKVAEEFNGKFAWVVDPEGNKIELWEPKAGY
jgi:catechol 2,3-dioxygenase-like lactoylglutathione lyase family enzyme